MANGEWIEDMIDHHSYKHLEAVVKLKPKKNSGMNMIPTHDLCHTSAVLYQLSYQATWELVTLWVCSIPVKGEECKCLYEMTEVTNRRAIPR